MPIRLIESLSTTEPLGEVFSDRSVLQSMLDFEVALARAEARLGIIPHSAARAIAKAAHPADLDTAALARETLRAGTPGIPLVNALRKRVAQEDAIAADFVHWGSTSQDVADTALVLLLKKAAPILEGDLARLQSALQALVRRHKEKVMLGRTLLQPAPPVTLGLKAAGWLGSVRRGRTRLNAALSAASVLQLGGASGTLAALGKRGIEVGESLAGRLRLSYPDAPWHTHRDRLADVICACGILTGSLGKMARDITLLMEAEVAEVAEPSGLGRGGSSTMPQKRNPIASSITLAAANRVPALTAAYLSQMIQEHERATGGWQAEWATISSVIQSTGVAIVSMAEAAEGLIVNEKRMKANLKSTRGTIFAEKAALLLSRKLGRERAHRLLDQATDPEQLGDRTLAEVLSQIPEVRESIPEGALRRLEDPRDYLGMAHEFADRLSRSASRRTRRRK
jgi:3-carboxy-cis,cis-muconate cycloisomerase